MSLSSIIMNSQMAKYGDMAVAGVGVAMKVTMMTGMVCIGLGQGVQPLLGYCVGAKNWERYRSAFKFSLIFGFFLSAVLTLICYLFTGQIVSVFLTDAAAYDYGLPGEGDLAQEDALERARETVRERFGLSQEALSRYTDVLVYFDATDPDAPLWRFVFQPEMGARDALGQTQYDLRYRVEIASPAGDVASAEAFKRQIPVYDLSYLMNLY